MLRVVNTRRGKLLLFAAAVLVIGGMSSGLAADSQLVRFWFGGTALLGAGVTGKLMLSGIEVRGESLLVRRVFSHESFPLSDYGSVEFVDKGLRGYQLVVSDAAGTQYPTELFFGQPGPEGPSDLEFLHSLL